ncbi:hypothetical protein V1294_005751 [Bradyrhizobium sp. AZCC 1678]
MVRKRFNALGANLPGSLHAETGPLRQTYLLARAGVVLQIFPAVGDLAA